MEKMDKEMNWQEGKPEAMAGQAGPAADQAAPVPAAAEGAEATSQPSLAAVESEAAAPPPPPAAAEAEGTTLPPPAAAEPEGTTLLPPAAGAAAATPPPAARGRFSALAAALLVALGAVLGAAGGTVATWKAMESRTPRAVPATTRPASVSVARPVVLAGQEVDLPALYEQVAPGVVRIDSADGTGTGFVVDAAKGYILTNYHVVAGQETVEVLLHDGLVDPVLAPATLEGKVLGTDPSTDLALVQVETEEVLTELPLGDSDTVRLGELAIAIGYPLDAGKSITAGIISGLNRLSEAPNRRTLAGLIQTDAAINPGNSGGPLLNAAGEVIGINTQIESPVRGFTGIGYAVPINAAKRALPELAKGGEVKHPWLGISGAPVEVLEPAEKQQMGLQVDRGVWVYQVFPNSPAAKAGLRPIIETDFGQIIPPDVILAVDGRPVRKVPDLTQYLDTRRVGDTITLTVNREGREIELQVTLEAWPDRLD